MCSLCRVQNICSSPPEGPGWSTPWVQGDAWMLKSTGSKSGKGQLTVLYQSLGPRSVFAFSPAHSFSIIIYLSLCTYYIFRVMSMNQQIMLMNTVLGRSQRGHIFQSKLCLRTTRKTLCFRSDRKLRFQTVTHGILGSIKNFRKRYTEQFNLHLPNAQVQLQSHEHQLPGFQYFQSDFSQWNMHGLHQLHSETRF